MVIRCVVIDVDRKPSAGSIGRLRMNSENPGTFSGFEVLHQRTDLQRNLSAFATERRSDRFVFGSTRIGFATILLGEIPSPDVAGSPTVP